LLEDRWVLSPINWNGQGGDLNWGNPGNWDLNRVPMMGDDVMIPTLGGSVSITHANGTDTVQNITSGTNIILSGGTLTVTGNLEMSFGIPFTIKGGTLASATVIGDALLVFTSNGGTLSGVTVNGTMDLTQQNPRVTVYGGLTLNGTMLLGNAAGSTYGRVVFGNSSSAAGSLTGTATIVFGGSGNNLIENQSNLTGALGTLTIGSTVTIHGKSGVIDNYYNNGSLANQGTINADTTGGTLRVGGGSSSAFTNTGTLSAQNGGTLSVVASLTISGRAILSESPSSSMLFKGNLLATAASAAQFNLQGQVTLNGTGTASSPQFLEALSQDLGTDSTAFNRNYAYGTLALANNHMYVKLIDSSGSGSKVLYANSLIVPQNATLDLNGLKLYTRAEQVAGQIVNGTPIVIPDSGPLNLAAPTPGTISPAGELDEWTFFGRGGRSVTVAVNPGTTGAPAPVAP
jgi:hypothetical protein